MKKLFKVLKEKNIKISFAESMTGGYLTYQIAKYPNASKVLKGSIVSYSIETKINILKVDVELIDKYSVVSKEVSESMCEGLKRIIDSDLYISITGNAGPGYEKNTNELICYYSIFYNNKMETYQHKFKSKNRLKNIKIAIKNIEEKVIKIINKNYCNK